MRNAGLKEAQVGIKISRININNLRYADDTTIMAESEEELKSLLMKVKEESEKVDLKLNIQKTKVMASGPIASWEIDWETVETVSDFIFLGSKITADGDWSHEIKRRLLLERKVMTNLDSIFKSRDITLPTKVRLVKATGDQPWQDPGIPSGWTALASERKLKLKGRERGLIFLGLHRKPIKLLTRKLLCSRRLQEPSQWGENAGCPLPCEDAGCLPDWVLEAQAKKWTQRASAPGVSLKEKEREREKKKELHGETKLLWASPVTLFLKRAFIPLVVHRG